MHVRCEVELNLFEINKSEMGDEIEESEERGEMQAGLKYAVQYLDGEKEEKEFISRPGELLVVYPTGDVFIGSYSETGDGDGKLWKQGKGCYFYTLEKERKAVEAEEEEEEDSNKSTSEEKAGEGEHQGGQAGAQEASENLAGKLLDELERIELKTMNEKLYNYLVQNDGASNPEPSDLTVNVSSIYQGGYESNTKSGIGVFYFANGDRYQGNWKGDRFNGYGNYFFDSSGDMYCGNWVDGLKHGVGTYIFKSYSNAQHDQQAEEPATFQISLLDDHVLEGVWLKGELHTGKWKHPRYIESPQYRIWVGSFKDNKPHGQGVMLTDEDEIECELVDGVSQSNASEEGGEKGTEADGDDDGPDHVASHKKLVVVNSMKRLRGDMKDYLEVDYDSIQREIFLKYCVPLSLTQAEESFQKEEEAKCNTEKQSSSVSNEAQTLSQLFTQLGMDAEEQGDDDPAANETNQATQSKPQLCLEKLQQYFETNSTNASAEESPVTSAVMHNQVRQLLLVAPRFTSVSVLLECMKLVDEDHNGVLCEEEMVEFFYLCKLFCTCDQDDSGAVTQLELQQAMLAHPGDFPEGFVDGDATKVGVMARLKVGDADGDKKLSFEEFVHMMLKLRLTEASANLDTA